MPYTTLKRRLATTIGVATLLAACNTSDLLKVQAPNSVPADIYSNPAYASLMVNSVIGDFECAFGSFVVSEGLVSDTIKLKSGQTITGTWIGATTDSLPVSTV